MRIAVFYEHNPFGRNFYSSLKLGLSTHPHLHTVVPYEIRHVDDLATTISSWKEKPDLIIGPNTSAWVNSLLSIDKIPGIPVITTQATSSALENKNSENYFHLAVSDMTRVKFLLEKIAMISSGFSDVYLFTKKDGSNSYSTGIRHDFIRNFTAHPRFSKHIFVDYQFDVSSEYDPNLDTDIIKSIKIEPELQINPRYPIIICSESLPMVHLVKSLKDKGITNTIFAFGTNNTMHREIMKGVYFVSDKDDDVARDDDGSEFRKNSVTYDLGVHLSSMHEEHFGREKFLTFVGGLKGRSMDALALRRLNNKYETEIVKGREIVNTSISSFTDGVLRRERILTIILAVIGVLATIIFGIMAL